MSSEREALEKGWKACYLCGTRQPDRHLEPVSGTDGDLLGLACVDAAWCVRFRDQRRKTTNGVHRHG